MFNVEAEINSKPDTMTTPAFLLKRRHLFRLLPCQLCRQLCEIAMLTACRMETKSEKRRNSAAPPSVSTQNKSVGSIIFNYIIKGLVTLQTSVGTSQPAFK